MSDNADGEGYSNWKARLAATKNIPHYYGDYVRQLFVVMAILSFIATPLWGDLLPFGVIPQVGAGVLLIILAGLTNAKSQYVLIADATLSAVSALLLESAAIILRTTEPIQLFIAREAGVVIMLAALYFSVKTVRNMMTGKLGHEDSLLEFEEIIEEHLPEEQHLQEPIQE